MKSLNNKKAKSSAETGSPCGQSICFSKSFESAINSPPQREEIINMPCEKARFFAAGYNIKLAIESDSNNPRFIELEELNDCENQQKSTPSIRR